MKIEMLSGEEEVLREMCGGPITKVCAKLFAAVRGKLLLTGHAYQMNKETLALIAVLSGAVGAEPAEASEREIHETNGHKDPTPSDDINLDEQAALEAEQATMNRDAAGGEYKGYRIKWESDFKSTPKTPISKLEKGRPITVIEGGQRLSGRFVKVHPKKKGYATVVTSKMKKPYPVETHRIEIIDLSPPPTTPFQVQF